jgi:hypothetical protein
LREYYNFVFFTINQGFHGGNQRTDCSVGWRTLIFFFFFNVVFVGPESPTLHYPFLLPLFSANLGGSHTTVFKPWVIPITVWTV